MPKISNRPLVKLPRIRIWEDDYLYLKQLFDDSEMGFAGSVRKILSEYVSTVRARANYQIDHQAPLILPEDVDDLIGTLGEEFTR
jgi:hypothetical protein